MLQTVRTAGEDGYAFVPGLPCAGVDVFSRRHMAFSAAHEVLLQQSWMEARIDGVVAEVLGKSGVDHFVLVDGP